MLWHDKKTAWLAPHPLLWAGQNPRTTGDGGHRAKPSQGRKQNHFKPTKPRNHINKNHINKNHRITVLAASSAGQTIWPKFKSNTSQTDHPEVFSKKLFVELWAQGLYLITGIRRNIKNYWMPICDKVLVQKRFIIETLFDKLKSKMRIEHTRHRSPTNAFVHILSCLAAYMLGKNKVVIKGIAYP